MVGGECSEWFGGRLGGRVMTLWGNRSNPMDGFDKESWDSPSIGSRISTCLWRVGRRIGSRTGNNHCGKMDLDGSVDVPTLQDEEWLVCGWVHPVHDHHLCHVVLLVDVERLSAM